MDVDKIIEILGFDPCSHNPNNAVLQAALTELQTEREQALKAKAKELLVECAKLVEERNRAEQQFKGQIAQFDKKLRKLYNRITSMQSGKPVEEENESVE